MTFNHNPNLVQVLYEDNHVCVVLKPAGLSTQGTAGEPESLMDLMKAWLKEKYAKPGNVFLGLIHRLDMPVEGLVVFGKTSKGASRLSEQVRNHQVKKEYLALVVGRPPRKSGRLTHYLSEQALPKVEVSGVAKEGYRECILDYEEVASDGKHTLLKIDLKTGRRHQIRVQLSHIGCPIVGDKKYGSKETFLPNAIGLVSHRLSFFHATEREKWIEVEIPEASNSVLRWWHERN